MSSRYQRVCYNCGGVSESDTYWMCGTAYRTLDNCDHCKAPLTEADDNTYEQVLKRYKKKEVINET